MDEIKIHEEDGLYHAMFHDFVSFEESLYGFGESPEEAIHDLWSREVAMQK